MVDFFEIDEKLNTIRSINLDDFSVEDLNKYLEELNQEISRVNIEIKKKSDLKKNAENFFK